MKRLLSILLIAWCGSAGLLQAAPKVALLSTGFVMSHKFTLMEAAAREQGVELAWVQVDAAPAEQLQAALQGAERILIDTPRPDDQAKVEAAAGAFLRETRVPIVQINRMTPQARLVAINAPQEVAQRIAEYYLNGMPVNRQRLFTYLRAWMEARDLNAVAAAQPLPAGAIYHPAAPQQLFTALPAYLDWWRSRQGVDPLQQPVVAMETTSSYLADGQERHLDEVIQALETAGAVPVVFYREASRERREWVAPAGARPAAVEPAASSPFPNPQAVQRAVSSEPLLTLEGRPLANVLLVNTFLGGDVEGRKARYQALGIPVLNVLHYTQGDAAAYREDLAGVDAFRLPFTLTNAEYIGIQDPVILTVNAQGEKRSLPEQLDLLVGKALALARLQRLPNAQKRVALFFWNSPPGENNQGASNMNVPRSLARLTRDLQAEGYALSPVAEQQMIDAVAQMLRPAYRPEALSELMRGDLWDFLPLSTYKGWLKTLPPAVAQEMDAHWGRAEDSPQRVTHNGVDGFVIPRLALGNLVILPQPARGGSSAEQEKDLLHDTKKVMNHYYAAVYLWAREQFASDAIIHFGTHGSQEWHPGKERGLWAFDAPNLAVGNVPVLYPYIVDNIGEALHVKRRGRGVVISHQTPAFSPAGLSDDFVALNEQIREYHALDEGLVRANTRRAILEQVTAMQVLKDLDRETLPTDAEFPAFLRGVEDYLEDLGAAMQPLGLHTFGETAPDEHLALNLMLILGDELLQVLGSDAANDLRRADYRQIRDSEPYRFVLRHLVQGTPLDAPSAAQQAVLEKGRRHLENLKAARESQALIDGLSARWIDPSYGGDPIRNPDALPTGRNMYGFDPSRVPTRAAHAAGVEALEGLLESHRATQGQAPRRLAFSMWSTETLRHLGMLEAQIFHALGVQPRWDSGGRVIGLEVIPLERLGRPRVDVVISLTGLYRDQFPNVMERFNEAIALVAALDEPPEQNPVRANTLRIEQQLLADGMPAQDARNFALTRVFGTESGDYGTQLPDATLASDKWDEKDGKLAELYLSRMSWAYGPDTTQWSRKPAGANGRALNVYAEQLKGTDAAMFSRSSNLRGLLDTDHPFEYLGGISLALQHLEGKAPQLYIANLRNPDKARLQSAERFMATELRAVYQHPNWIKEMQQEGYAGTLELLSAINNFWGWQVMDRNVVRDDQWEEFHQVYMADKYALGTREWFEQHNADAMGQIAERMLEAIRKGYWQASEETQRQLVQLYQELAAKHDLHTRNEAFKRYVAELSAGYGLTGPAPQQAALSAASKPAAMPETPAAEASQDLPVVQGQLMQEVQPPAPQPRTWYWLGLLLLGLCGLLYQAWYTRRTLHP
ncbi:cobaltochelatase subunit CobN [Pseudomonas sp. NW5]|uniref:cobaltochelatase subunit CobN n=1 Tax=Pseudomonas sp. NW5 TaxID=2934934 RepID=UPI0020212EFD|nr:cobaltochelatase subunit CobN [Pseudomonas sp. NW5]MCL7462916.1 cobaltochelatase subunit CobN [Pseudomonas sp. NW5]